jgi:hypothetical protein
MEPTLHRAMTVSQPNCHTAGANRLVCILVTALANVVEQSTNGNYSSFRRAIIDARTFAIIGQRQAWLAFTNIVRFHG